MTLAIKKEISSLVLQNDLRVAKNSLDRAIDMMVSGYRITDNRSFLPKLQTIPTDEAKKIKMVNLFSTQSLLKDANIVSEVKKQNQIKTLQNLSAIIVTATVQAPGLAMNLI